MEPVSSREVYRNAWMSVREDRVLLPDGQPGTYGVVDKPDFALVVPREDDGDLWLVEQYRYPVARRVWEFPQGSWPASTTGSPVELAAAELREETGLRAAHLLHVGHLHEAPGFCSQGFDVWLATGLVPGPPSREATEQDMRCRRVSDAELRRMARDGELVDAASLAAYALCALQA
ncbi:MAG: ADP-ribose pyrophosphatase [uncultured Frankineae bacterium]|uniref:ADP-ribose pyrophosphatase n=1 Tax=uncultured Frankineae bacterium TaxID=437475 RepID=A0A6J4MD11_9ACTN|nr:MAG: ADP-ribose pyrophosphatase [uncultured Frankineae bacterium]